MTNQEKEAHGRKVTLSLSSFDFNVFGSMQALTSLVCNSEWQRDVYIYIYAIYKKYACMRGANFENEKCGSTCSIAVNQMD